MYKILSPPMMALNMLELIKILVAVVPYTGRGISLKDSTPSIRPFNAGAIYTGTSHGLELSNAYRTYIGPCESLAQFQTLGFS